MAGKLLIQNEHKHQFLNMKHDRDWEESSA